MAEAGQPGSENQRGGAGSLWGEVRHIGWLSLPIVGSQVGFMLTGFVDVLMVARLGVAELGATAIGNLLYWVMVSIGLGAVSGADPLISQAHGAGRALDTGRALQSALAVAALTSIPIVALLYASEELLLLAGQPAGVAQLAGVYNRLRAPGVPAFLLFNALRTFLQGRGHMLPATYVIWGANVLNVVLNWALIWGHWGAPALGFEGAALASLITACSLPLLLIGWIRWQHLAQGAWPGWQASTLRPGALWRVLRLGIPVGFHMGLEAGAFGTATAMAGHLGVVALGAHQVVVQITALIFMVPLGISMAASIRVGNLIGAGQRQAMRKALHASLILGASVGAISAITLLVFRFEIPELFGIPAQLVLLASVCLPVAAAFQIVDGVQVVAAGLLRGMGRAQATAWLNLAAWGVVGLPAAYWLSDSLGYGLVGIWSGLALGLGFAALSLGTWVLIAPPLNVD